MSPQLLLEPSQVFAELETKPPLMREQTAKSYIGKEVDWALNFFDGGRQHAGRVRLMFDIHPYQVKMVTGEVNLSDYPELESMPSGEPMRVRGRVRAVDAICISLDIIELARMKVTETTR